MSNITFLKKISNKIESKTMTDKQKVYIRGVEGHGGEVIKTLTDLGAENLWKRAGSDPEHIYYISPLGVLQEAEDGSEAALMVKEYCREIRLPEQWEDGDILVRKDNDSIFCVYQKPADNGKGFLCYVYVSKDTCFTGVTIPTDSADNYCKATDAEKSSFYSLIDYHHVRWSAEKKQLVKYRWKPEMLEAYWVVTGTGHVTVLNWEDFPTDNDHLDFGNCFKTKEEAYGMVEKIKNLLKGGHE